MANILLCPGCGQLSFTVERRHLNTCYVNEDSNYTTCCLTCFQDLWDMYDEQWREYYSSQGIL
jgi:hypothetical protein